MGRSHNTRPLAPDVGDAMKFIDICDTSGRRSGFNVIGDKVTVRGKLEHHAEFTKDEMMKLAYQIAVTCADAIKHSHRRVFKMILDNTEKRAKLNCRIGRTTECSH